MNADRQTTKVWNWCSVKVSFVQEQEGWLEFNVPFQHKYRYIRDDQERRISVKPQPAAVPNDWLLVNIKQHFQHKQVTGYIFKQSLTSAAEQCLALSFFEHRRASDLRHQISHQKDHRQKDHHRKDYHQKVHQIRHQIYHLENLQHATTLQNYTRAEIHTYN